MLSRINALLQLNPDAEQLILLTKQYAQSVFAEISPDKQVDALMQALIDEAKQCELAEDWMRARLEYQLIIKFLTAMNRPSFIDDAYFIHAHLEMLRCDIALNTTFPSVAKLRMIQIRAMINASMFSLTKKTLVETSCRKVDFQLNNDAGMAVLTVNYAAQVNAYHFYRIPGTFGLLDIALSDTIPTDEKEYVVYLCQLIDDLRHAEISYLKYDESSCSIVWPHIAKFSNRLAIILTDQFYKSDNFALKLVSLNLIYQAQTDSIRYYVKFSPTKIKLTDYLQPLLMLNLRVELNPLSVNDASCLMRDYFLTTFTTDVINTLRVDADILIDINVHRESCGLNSLIFANTANAYVEKNNPKRKMDEADINDKPKKNSNKKARRAQPSPSVDQNAVKLNETGIKNIIRQADEFLAKREFTHSYNFYEAALSYLNKSPTLTEEHINASALCKNGMATCQRMSSDNTSTARSDITTFSLFKLDPQPTQERNYLSARKTQ